MTHQTTLAQPAMCAGIGLHTGERVRVRLMPAPADTGLVFRRTDVLDRDNVLRAHIDLVASGQLASVLRNGAGVEVSTVEHVLAACAGLGLDNAVIDVDGPELPIMDGSAVVFAQLIAQVGLKSLAAPRRFIEILKTVEVNDGVKWARLSPGTGRVFDVTIDFRSRAIGKQTSILSLEPDTFAEELAVARTFGFAQDVDAMRAMGLARGGSLDNAIVVDGDMILNPEGLRQQDEFVRHKVLDAVGDLALAGAPIQGVFTAFQPGHALNHRLMRALFADDSAWRWSLGEASPMDLVAAGR